MTQSLQDRLAKAEIVQIDLPEPSPELRLLSAQLEISNLKNIAEILAGCLERAARRFELMGSCEKNGASALTGYNEAMEFLAAYRKGKE